MERACAGAFPGHSGARRRALRKVLAAVLLLAPVLPALAQNELPEGKWWRQPRVAAQIGLAPEQADQVEKIFARDRSKLIDLRADLQKKQIAVESAMEDSATDRNEVEKRIAAVESARASLQKTRALMYLDMKQVLRPEQWNRLVRMRQEKQERMQERRREFARRERERQQRPNPPKNPAPRR